MWIDAAYDLHINMRGHKGGTISMGYGKCMENPQKQKINIKNSTESELVEMGKYVPYKKWFIMFMGEQGYAIKNNVIYQDNHSTIRMEKNGRNSCTGNSRHINIRYFFMKDKINKREMRVDYFPTHIMLVDFFTKQLMGGFEKN